MPVHCSYWQMSDWYGYYITVLSYCNRHCFGPLGPSFDLCETDSGMQLVWSGSPVCKRNSHGIKLLPLVAFKGLRFPMCPGTPFHAGPESIILRSETSVCPFWMGSRLRDFPGSATLCCSVIGSRGLDICKGARIEISCDAGSGPRARDNSNEGNSLPSTLSTARPCFSLLNSDYHSWLFHLPYFSSFSCPLYTCLRVCLCVRDPIAKSGLIRSAKAIGKKFSAVFFCIPCCSRTKHGTSCKW